MGILGALTPRSVSEFYAPKMHATIETEQTAIRQGLAKILAGQAARFRIAEGT